jgi:hypothetical protein
MSIYNGVPSYGIVQNPLTDSPYVQELDVGFATPPQVNVLLETNFSPLLLTTGQYLELA